MVIKKYPLDKYPDPPTKPPKKYQWSKVVKYKYHKTSVSAIYKRKRVHIKGYSYKRKRKIIRVKSYYRHIPVLVRRGYIYRRKTPVTYWQLEKVIIEQWLRAYEYLDRLDREIRKTHKLPILRPLSRYQVHKPDIKGVVEPYYNLVELTMLFNWYEEKLPVKDKFDIFFIYYYFKVYDSRIKNRYYIVFTNRSFPTMKSVGFDELVKIAVPKAVRQIESDINNSKADIEFVRYAFFSATEKKSLKHV